jgi:demethylmenaquinone methyltransferase / 2-methoxy-6-polyprenyl-1,4-benzoquinol methylase
MWKNYLLKHLGYLHLLRRMQYPIIIDYLKLIHPEQVLDIGCGNGDLLIDMARYSKALGFDLSIQNNIKAKIESLVNNPIILFEANAKEIPLKERCIDCITLSSVLQMVKNDNLLLKECYRILKPNGSIILTVPIGYVFISEIYKLSFKGKILRKLFSLPSSYNEFLNLLNKRFETEGKGFYSFEELEQVLNQEGFYIKSWEYCPKILGSILYEICLLLKWAGKSSLSVVGIRPMLLYPIGFFDRYLPKYMKGCEVIIYAARSSIE